MERKRCVDPGDLKPMLACSRRWVGYVARWTARCAGGLEGDVIHIDGLNQTSTDVLVRFDFADGVGEAHRLTPGDPSFTVPTQPSRLEGVRTYFSLGVEHILSGIDHLLLVLALLLLVNGVRRLIATVTAFTLAQATPLVTQINRTADGCSDVCFQRHRDHRRGAPNGILHRNN